MKFSWHSVQWGLISVLAILSGGLPASAWATPRPGLGEKIGEWIKKLETTPGTGVSIAVIDHGELVWLGGYGLRDRETGAPVTADTLFAIASITKTFTATALVVGQERGLLNLRAPMRGQLPGFALADPQANQLATPIDLLAHRTGLPRHESWWMLTPFYGPEQVRRIGFLPPNQKPELSFRRGFQYNNLTYTELGRLLQVRAGTSWWNFLQETMLRPIGMRRTTPSSLQAQADPDRARPYVELQAAPFAEVAAIFPAGAIHSSAREMALWLKLQMQDLRLPSGRRLLSPEGVQSMRTPETPIPVRSGKLAYGLGWLVQDGPRGRVIWHGGNLIGYTSNLAFIPEKGVGVVVLTNQHASRLAAQITDLTLDFLLGRGPSFAPGAGSLTEIQQELRARRLINDLVAPPARPRRPASWMRSSRRAFAPAELAGRYQHPAYGDLEIIANGQELTVRWYRNTSPLVPASTTGDYVVTFPFAQVFAIEEPVHFVEEGGRVVGLEIPFESESLPIRFDRLAFRLR